GTSGKNNGIGVEVEAVAQQFNQGNLTITGNTLDVAVNGNGFFTLQQSDGSMAYTRAGNFKLDKDGNLITNSGSHVMGYPAAAGTSLAPMVFPTGAPIAPRRTEKISAEFNLDAREPDGAVRGTSIEIFDDLGKPIAVDFTFTKTGDNTWEATYTLPGGMP